MGYALQVVSKIKCLIEILMKNKLTNTTGALLYSGGYFLKCYRGGGKAVDATFEYFQKDSHQKNVTLVRLLNINKNMKAKT